MDQKILEKFKSGKLDQINKQMSASRNKMDDHITQREVEIMNYKMANEMLTRYSFDELIEHALVVLNLMRVIVMDVCWHLAYCK